jgi:hypothetical protein
VLPLDHALLDRLQFTHKEQGDPQMSEITVNVEISQTSDKAWKIQTRDRNDRLVSFWLAKKLGSITRNGTQYAATMPVWLGRKQGLPVEIAVDPNAPQVPEITESQVFEGTVISLKSNDYHVLKMVVRDLRGFRVWGSVPKSISHVEVGETVKFFATATRSDDDPGFGFFKYPKNAKIVKSLDIENATWDNFS